MAIEIVGVYPLKMVDLSIVVLVYQRVKPTTKERLNQYKSNLAKGAYVQ